jgi:DNA-binding winged helix-turn-helix (wHTH) protein/tetratricopeptide (TPR) repeat protein
MRFSSEPFRLRSNKQLQSAISYMAESDLGGPKTNAYLFDSFEVSVPLGVLRQAGTRLKIQELPFQMLLVLLENRGKLVTKEELGKRLWDRSTFVEVDKSLYVMAGKLREALGDNATQPRFIKTVSGRGYCFIGNVTQVAAAPPAADGHLAAPRTDSIVLSLADEAVSARGLATDGTPAHNRTSAIRARSLLAGVALAGIFVLTVYAFVHRYRNRPLGSDQDRVVIGNFANSTGNPDFDKALSSAVELKVQESPYLGMIPYQRLRSLVKDPDSASLKDELHACASLDGQLLLKGQILALATGYRILLMAWSCADGRLLTTQKAEANSQAAILSALDLATERMRRRLGESESSLQKFNVPLMQATTPSLTALKAFTLGEEKRSQGLQAESIPSYKLAVDLDPQFALAYARLGNVYTNIGQASLSREYYQKAFDLRNRATDRERLYIITHYYAYTTGEIKRAIEDYELWRTLYPRDLVPTNNLAAEYFEMGQEPQKAVELARRAIQLDPTNKLSYAMLAQAYVKTGDYANVNVLCNDPEYAKTDFLGFHEVCFQAAFAQNDESGMQRQLQWAHGNPEESELLNDAALVAMSRGKVFEARRLFTEAKQNALQNNFVESAADIQLNKAKVEADFGFMREAREDALGALELASGNASEQAFAALALARAGDISHAQIEASKAASQAPLDTILNSAVLASVRAATQLQRYDSKGAVQSLEEARPFDFCDSMRLAPAYYRGLAYLQDKQPQQAIKEFQRVVDHRALADYPVYVVLSQLQLGRAFQLLGDRSKAARAFSEADKVWKDAEPSFPPLAQLRTYERELSEGARL